MNTATGTTKGQEIREPRKHEVVEVELAKLVAKYDHVTPEIVLREARDPAHPLHGFFDWNDRSAAEKYRITQARALIMQYRQETAPGEETKVRQLVPVFDGSTRYYSRDVIKSKPVERMSQVERAKSELRSWVKRWSDYPELDGVREAVSAKL